MSAADKALDDVKREARGKLGATLTRSYKEAETAGLALYLAHTGDVPSVDVRQLDEQLDAAVRAGRALEEAVAVYRAAHGRGRPRT